MAKEKKDNPNKVTTIMSSIVCLLLIIIPMPEFLNEYKPNWMLLLLIFLAINVPKEFNLGTAFFAGLLVDVAKGSLLGQHALASLIIVFLTTKYHLQIRNVPQIQLLTTVVILLVIFQFTLFWINGVSGISASFKDYWAPIVGSALIWPIFSRILSKYFVYTSSKDKI
ncbi:MAG TPA: rod shape-determining protein MreD [Woeseiaceae bacterium]|nr:rod shape-determining protein MreD [Woeseiaceae bacterium]|tara:strand:+ start:2411 stop:2914 length:504 start_codon:yes stop_codon:yes gene_type:complete